MQFSVLSAALLLAGFGGAAPTSEESARSQAVCGKATCCSEQTAAGEGEQSPLRQLAAEAAATFVANLLEQVDEKSSSCGTCKELDGEESPVRKALRATLRDLIKSKTVQTVVFSSRQKETVRHASAEKAGSDLAARKRSLHLRKVARHLDRLADTLEDEQLGEQADELRETAQRLRKEANEVKQAKEQGSSDAEEATETSASDDAGEVPAPPKELETGEPQTHHSVNEFDIDIAFGPAVVREEHRKTLRRIFLTSALVPDATVGTESLTVEQLRGQVRELRHLVHRLQVDIHRMQRSESR